MNWRLMSGIAAGLLACSVAMQASAQTTPQQRMSECARQWDAMKAKNQTTGRNYRDFQRDCLAGRAPATIGSAPNSAARTPRRPSTTVPAGANVGVAETQRNCPSDMVVWVNPETKVYHFSGSRFFGHTKQGSYMCRAESERAGFRAAKNEKATATR
jgi:hypothetical protein